MNIPGIPIININSIGNNEDNENQDQSKKKVVIPTIPKISLNPFQSNQTQQNSDNEIPKIPLLQPFRSETRELPLSSIPELNIDLSTKSLPGGKERIYDKKPVIICIPFMKDNIKDKTAINKKIINFFGGTADYTDLPSNLTVVEYNNDTSSLIPSFQMIDAAYQETKHLPKMIDKVTNESSSVFTIIEETMNDIEKLKAQKEELIVKNAVMKEKIRSANEEISKFNESAVKMKNSFDEFLKKIPQT